MSAATILLPGVDGPVRVIGTHESGGAITHTWLTPPYILDALGPFDLDPCACPLPRPWPTAATMWTREDGALNRPWFGRVFCNPPYGHRSQVGPWMHRMALHNHGVALIFARVETALFFETVWGAASAVLFPRGRVRFFRQSGTVVPTGGSSRTGDPGAPSVLVAYGAEDAERLRTCGIAGHYVPLMAAQ